MCRKVGFILLLASATGAELDLESCGSGSIREFSSVRADVEVKAEWGREKGEEERENQKWGQNPIWKNTSDFLAVIPPCLVRS